MHTYTYKHTCIIHQDFDPRAPGMATRIKVSFAAYRTLRAPDTITVSLPHLTGRDWEGHASDNCEVDMHMTVRMMYVCVYIRCVHIYTRLTGRDWEGHASDKCEVNMHMTVCMMYALLCMWMYVYTPAWHASDNSEENMHMTVCMCIYTRLTDHWSHMCMGRCLCVYVCVCHIYTHTYIHKYIHTQESTVTHVYGPLLVRVCMRVS
jgi:hypothetical protein